MPLLHPPPMMGLSPRVRGKPLSAWRNDTKSGSIPACAGEAPRRSRRPAPAWVYPRVCGGSVPPGPAAPVLPGLSPRVRGKHNQQLGKV